MDKRDKSGVRGVEDPLARGKRNVIAIELHDDSDDEDNDDEGSNDDGAHQTQIVVCIVG